MRKGKKRKDHPPTSTTPLPPASPITPTTPLPPASPTPPMTPITALLTAAAEIDGKSITSSVIAPTALLPASAKKQRSKKSPQSPVPPATPMTLLTQVADGELKIKPAASFDIKIENPAPPATETPDTPVPPLVAPPSGLTSDTLVPALAAPSSNPLPVILSGRQSRGSLMNPESKQREMLRVEEDICAAAKEGVAAIVGKFSLNSNFRDFYAYISVWSRRIAGENTWSSVKSHIKGLMRELKALGMTPWSQLAGSVYRELQLLVIQVGQAFPDMPVISSTGQSSTLSTNFESKQWVRPKTEEEVCVLAKRWIDQIRKKFANSPNFGLIYQYVLNCSQRIADEKKWVSIKGHIHIAGQQIKSLGESYPLRSLQEAAGFTQQQLHLFVTQLDGIFFSMPEAVPLQQPIVAAPAPTAALRSNGSGSSSKELHEAMRPPKPKVVSFFWQPQSEAKLSALVNSKEKPGQPPQPPLTASLGMLSDAVLNTNSVGQSGSSPLAAPRRVRTPRKAKKSAVSPAISSPIYQEPSSTRQPSVEAAHAIADSKAFDGLMEHVYLINPSNPSEVRLLFNYITPGRSKMANLQIKPAMRERLNEAFKLGDSQRDRPVLQTLLVLGNCAASDFLKDSPDLEKKVSERVRKNILSKLTNLHHLHYSVSFYSSYTPQKCIIVLREIAKAADNEEVVDLIDKTYRRSRAGNRLDNIPDRTCAITNKLGYGIVLPPSVPPFTKQEDESVRGHLESLANNLLKIDSEAKKNSALDVRPMVALIKKFATEKIASILYPSLTPKQIADNILVVPQPISLQSIQEQKKVADEVTVQSSLPPAPSSSPMLVATSAEQSSDSSINHELKQLGVLSTEEEICTAAKKMINMISGNFSSRSKSHLISGCISHLSLSIADKKTWVSIKEAIWGVESLAKDYSQQHLQDEAILVYKDLQSLVEQLDKVFSSLQQPLPAVPVQTGDISVSPNSSSLEDLPPPEELAVVEPPKPKEPSQFRFFSPKRSQPENKLSEKTRNLQKLADKYGVKLVSLSTKEGICTAAKAIIEAISAKPYSENFLLKQCLLTNVGIIAREQTWSFMENLVNGLIGQVNTLLTFAFSPKSQELTVSVRDDLQLLLADIQEANKMLDLTSSSGAPPTAHLG